MSMDDFDETVIAAVNKLKDSDPDTRPTFVRGFVLVAMTTDDEGNEGLFVAESSDISHMTGTGMLAHALEQRLS